MKNVFTSMSKLFCVEFVECRMAGTANDYVGKLSKTRAGYECSNWLLENDLSAKADASTVPTVTKRTRRPILKTSKFRPYDPYPLLAMNTEKPEVTSKATTYVASKLRREYLNDSLYADGSVKNATNYCRNPSRNIAGAWCFTADPVISQDLCNVRDCEKPGTIRIQR